MKKSLRLIFIIIFIILPTTKVFAATPFIASEFIYEGNIFVRNIDFSGKAVNTFWISSLDFLKGINIACGDVDNDKEEEIVVVYESERPKIKIFSQDGKPKYSEFTAYNNISNGLNIALGDLNSDNAEEIILGPKNQGNFPIKIFNYKGDILNSGFYPFSDNLRSGINLDSGDIDGNGMDEIIVGTGIGARSEIRVFNSSGDLMPIDFYPFVNNYLGGIDISGGDIDGDGKNEIVTCQSIRDKWCKIYKYNKNKTILNEWQITGLSGKIKIDTGDIDRDGKEEIIISSKNGENLQVQIYKSNKELISSFNAYGSNLEETNFDIFFDSKKDKAKVTYVDDGDTIFLNGSREIRYIGIDTPEIGENYYIEATNRNKELLFEKEVGLEYDQQKIDPHGRVLAYIYSNGDFVNAKLLEEGLAKVKTFPPNEKYLYLLKEKEQKAKEEKLGIWSKGSSNNKKFSFWDLFGFLKLFF